MNSFIFRMMQRIAGFIASIFCPAAPVAFKDVKNATMPVIKPKAKETPMTRDQKIADIAGKLGVPPAWLSAVIAFESNYDPQAKAGMPYNQKKVASGFEEPKYARGLIQFIDSTAEELGYGDAEYLVTVWPDFNSQMDNAVLPYFLRYAPFPTEQSLYLAVFYPAYRNKPLSTVFPDSVQAANPRIVTVGDYVNKVKTTALARNIGGPVVGIGVLVLGLIAWRYLS